MRLQRITVDSLPNLCHYVNTKYARNFKSSPFKEKIEWESADQEGAITSQESPQAQAQ